MADLTLHGTFRLNPLLKTRNMNVLDGALTNAWLSYVKVVYDYRNFLKAYSTRHDVCCGLVKGHHRNRRTAPIDIKLIRLAKNVFCLFYCLVLFGFRYRFDFTNSSDKLFRLGNNFLRFRLWILIVNFILEILDRYLHLAHILKVLLIHRAHWQPIIHIVFNVAGFSIEWIRVEENCFNRVYFGFFLGRIAHRRRFRNRFILKCLESIMALSWSFLEHWLICAWVVWWSLAVL